MHIRSLLDMYQNYIGKRKHDEEEGSTKKAKPSDSDNSVEERRVADDGNAYTKREFIYYYGGSVHWDEAAKEEDCKEDDTPLAERKRKRAIQRKQEVPGDGLCIAPSGGQFSLLKASQDAYEEYYQKPYDGKDDMPTSGSEAMRNAFALEYESWNHVERPNHGLAHAIRKALLVPSVAKAYCGTRDGVEESDLPSNDTMQLAMLMEVAGRRSEIGFTECKDVYLAYKEASCNAFESYATSANLQGREDCLQGLKYMYEAEASESYYHVAQASCHTTLHAYM